MKLISVERLNQREVSIDWFIGKRCNFDCSYCSSDIHDNFSPHQNLVHLKSTAQKFIDAFQAQNLQIGITGGEPTVNSSLVDFVSFLKGQGVNKVSVTSNGSRTADYYINLSQYLGTLTFSQHFEFVDDSFLDKIKIINEQRHCKNLFVQVMANSNHWESLKTSVDFYIKNNISFTIRKIRDRFNTISAAQYTKEQEEWISSFQTKKITPNCKITFENKETKEVFVNEISNNDLNKFKGWTCWAGLKHFHIWHDGTVYRGNCRQGGELGSIQKGFEIPTTPVVCDLDTCFCAPEVTVKKLR